MKEKKEKLLHSAQLNSLACYTPLDLDYAPKCVTSFIFKMEEFLCRIINLKRGREYFHILIFTMSVFMSFANRCKCMQSSFLHSLPPVWLTFWSSSKEAGGCFPKPQGVPGRLALYVTMVKDLSAAAATFPDFEINANIDRK